MATALADRVAPPEVVIWKQIRSGLSEPDGQKFFDDRVKDALIPGGVNGVRALRGEVVAVEPKVITLSVEAKSPDVRLEILTAGKIPELKPGDIVLFQGIARRFQRDPFMLTFEIGPDCFIKRDVRSK